MSYAKANLFKTPAPGQPLPRPADDAPIEEMDRWEEHEVNRLHTIQTLPHLYGWKWYTWAAEFRDSTNKINLLCAANQISKSSTQIRKCIIWATDQDLWPTLWQQKPIQFWYLYPTQKQVNAEFQTKWLQFLPRGEMKDDEFFGWKIEKSKQDIIAIHFNSGVHLYFKTYSQNVSALQSGTCEAIFCDEELPILVGEKNLFDELMLRISASDGYFHMVFTATIGQDEWRRAMDPTPEEIESGKEFLPQAYKRSVSLYEALTYEDGTNSHWTLQKIKQVEDRCSTHNEVLKRVYGKFIVIGGRKYESFDIKRHMKPKHPVPKGWLIYAGADIGSGGGDQEENAEKNQGHKAALCYVAVKPDYSEGRVFLGWRGDGVITTAGDVVNKHISLKKTNKLKFTGRFYDWASADFGTIATRMGEPFQPADKSHSKGEDVINTLFKNDMLFIYEDPELAKLAGELSSLKKNVNKKHAKDDFADALRYAVTKIPWDWSKIEQNRDIEPEPFPLSELQKEINERRKAFEDDEKSEAQRIEEEFNEWNDLY